MNLRLIAPALLVCLTGPCLATEPLQTLHWSVNHETWSLPEGERMGVVGGHVMADMGSGLALGVASYGAVRGERGGFITLGPQAQMRWPLSGQTDLMAGLFVGAGGGRNGVSLAGGGLMLRSHLGMEYQIAPAHRLGLGLSHVRFPDGRIQSTQPFVSYSYSLGSQLYGGWPEARSLPARTDTAAVFTEQELAVTGHHYRFNSGTTRSDGQSPQHPRMQLAGVQWTGYVDPHWFVQVGTDGALGGQSAGYMQILAGLGYRLPLSNHHAIKLHGRIGPAGGGDTDTGGGTLTDMGLSWQWRALRHQSIEFSLSDVRAPSASFHATSLGLKLVHHLQDATPGAEALDMQRLRWRLAQQTYLARGTTWRNSHNDTPVNNLGIQLDYLLSPSTAERQWFLTGQGLAAYHGEAGAYMTGLLGAGVHQHLSGPWSAELEALVGAAGGGGLRTGGGLVGQINAGLGYQFTPQFGLLLSAGRLQAARDSLRVNTVGIAAVYRFSRATR